MRANTWLNPKSWKWLIRQVLTNKRTQPNQKTTSRSSTASRSLNRPDDRLGDRLPLPVQDQQHEAGKKDIGAALDRRRHEARPHALEAFPRHDAVLHSEQPEQHRVDEQALEEWSGHARVRSTSERRNCRRSRWHRAGRRERRRRRRCRREPRTGPPLLLLTDPDIRIGRKLGLAGRDSYPIRATAIPCTQI